MCGMVARLSRDQPVDVSMRKLQHRGMRSRVIYNQWGAIGHVRLPIVGVGPENDQPRHTYPWTTAFVGEVLDFKDDHPDFDCDFDLVEEAWHQRGPRGLKDRDGFWSVLAIDDRDGSLHVLCDYLAQKPMYYRTDSICAASELDAVACVAPVTIDEVYMSSVAKWGYCPEVRRTPYAEISRVLPGEHVAIDQTGFMNRTIADPLVPASLSSAELRNEIVLATKRRVLSSDVPVAALVSGGLDSSIVFALSRRFGTVVSYTVRMGDPAEALALDALMLDSNYNVNVVVPGSIGMADALSIMQEPVDLGSLVPQIALSEAVQERVCLTGDGADELFGGYSRATRYDSQASDVWQELVAWHLPRLDRVMMRRKIEVRSPFLARRVAAAALALPWEARNDGKELLKIMFADLLPREVLELRKVPLRTPGIEHGREENSIQMISLFRERFAALKREAA